VALQLKHLVLGRNVNWMDGNEICCQKDLNLGLLVAPNVSFAFVFKSICFGVFVEHLALEIGHQCPSKLSECICFHCTFTPLTIVVLVDFVTFLNNDSVIAFNISIV
jgi:hypothetical protein